MNLKKVCLASLLVVSGWFVATGTDRLLSQYFDINPLVLLGVGLVLVALLGQKGGFF